MRPGFSAGGSDLDQRARRSLASVKGPRRTQRWVGTRAERALAEASVEAAKKKPTHKVPAVPGSCCLDPGG